MGAVKADKLPICCVIIWGSDDTHPAGFKAPFLANLDACPLFRNLRSATIDRPFPAVYLISNDGFRLPQAPCINRITENFAGGQLLFFDKLGKNFVQGRHVKFLVPFDPAFDLRRELFRCHHDSVTCFPCPIISGFQFLFRVIQIPAVKNELFKIVQGVKVLCFPPDLFLQQFTISGNPFRGGGFRRVGFGGRGRGPLVFIVNPAFRVFVAPKLNAPAVVYFVENAVFLCGVGLANDVALQRGIFFILFAKQNLGFRGLVLLKCNVLHFGVLL